MKKGLRPSLCRYFSISLYFNRRPDEEGIKTDGPGTRSRSCWISTADLMKKGLRPHHRIERERVDISTADLMKKGLRPCPCATAPPRACISTADLMKKGLRHVIQGRLVLERDISTADLMKKGLRHLPRQVPDAGVAFQPQT